MYHDIDECCEDYPEYADVFDCIDGLAIMEDARCEEDPYANDWEAAGFQPEWE